MNPEIHTLTGAYALNALSETERQTFEHHLDECAACAQEVTELQETAARLGTAAATETPQRLRDAVAAEIDRTRQQPPHASSAPRHSRTRRWALPAGGVVAAAAMVAAVVFGVQWGQAQQQLHHTRQQLAAVSSVLSAPDAVTSHGNGKHGGTAMAVASAAQDKAVLMVSGLASLPNDRTYQAWFITPTGAHSAGLLHPAGHDRMQPLIGTVPAGTEKVGVTVEPTGGSRHPSMGHLMMLFPLT